MIDDEQKETEELISGFKLNLQVQIERYLDILDIMYLKKNINESRYNHLRHHIKALVGWVIKEHKNKMQKK